MKKLILFFITAVTLISLKTIAQEEPKELFEKSWILEDSTEKRILREKIIKLYPESEYAFFCKGWLKTDKEEYADAVDFFSKAININNEFWQAYYHRGNTYGVLKDYQNAISDISKALELNPEYGEGYFVRGAAYFLGVGNKEQGCEDWQKALSLGNEKAGAYITKFCK
ncbi:MAG: tetratricopeptide repeat protein [Ignavibacteria bacterium]